MCTRNCDHFRSVGCTTVEMITGRPPLADCEPMAALFRIGQATTDFTTFIPKSARACLRHTQD